MDSQSDSKTMAISKCGRSPDPTKSRVDLCDTLNAKRNQEEDLCDKLSGDKVTTVSKVISASLAVRTIHNNFHQLIESFVARFVINTKAPKGIGSLLTLRKGKSKTVCNYSKRY